MPAETDCYGKKTSELGEVTFSEDGKLSGTLKHVTGYTGFNGSDPSEQSGYYLPFLYGGNRTLKMYVKNKEKAATVDKASTPNVVFLGADRSTAQKAALHLNGTGASAEIAMSGLTFQ